MAQQGQNLPTVLQQKLTTARAMLEKMKPQLLMVVSNPKYVDSITRVAMTSIQRNPKLLDCTQTSLMGAIMQSAQLGLEPDDVRGLSFLVPYGSVCTLVPGYRGLLYLALQTDGVQDVYAKLVRENDDFEYEEGSAPTLMHRPEIDSDPGPVVGGYYMIVFSNGYRRFGYMSRDQLDDVKKQALANKRNPNSPDLPWNRNEDEMQLKTLIRRACKTLPQNSRLSTAVSLDEMAHVGIPQGLETLVDPQAVAEGADTGAEKPKIPTEAPRKSAKQEQPAESPAPADSEPPPQETHPVDPAAKVSPARVEELTEKMLATDTRVGRRVALGEMAKTFGHKNLSALTNQQADQLVAALDAIPAEAPQS